MIPRTLMARFQAWRAFHRRLDALLDDHYRKGYHCSAATYRTYEEQARAETR